MSPYRLEIAGPQDEQALQSILQSTEMSGHVRLGFERSPSYFGADRIGNDFCQTIIARFDGEPVGVGGRAVRRLHVGGRAEVVGYLSGLRILRAHRSGSVLARGYRLLRQLHADGRAPWYFSTVLSENTEAIRLLESGRASLPRYDFAGEFHTFVFRCRRRRAAHPRTVPDPASFLGAYARLVAGRDMSPVVEEADLKSDGPWFGVRPDDLYIARSSDGEPIATLGLWDQRPIRQTVVHGYSPWVRRFRWVANLVGRLRGLPSLPAEGTCLEMIHTTLAAYPAGQHDVFASLVDEAVAACGGRAEHLVLGLPENDPVAACLRARGHHLIRSRVYQVWWPESGWSSPPKISPLGACLDVSTL